MANNRIYYACQLVEINGPSGTASGKNTGWDQVNGLQSVGMNTNFNLEPVYQLGQLELYDNYEEIPEVEISLNKVLDGTMTLYGMTMGTGALSTLVNHRCGARLTLFPDTAEAGTGIPIAQVTCVPAYCSQVTYTFPTEGNFTEEVTLVSNDKTWSTGLSTHTSTSKQSSATGVGILRRGLWSKESILPNSGVGVVASTVSSSSGGIAAGLKIQNVTVSMSLGRESIYNLGERTPYFRYVNFPVEVTCEIECIANTGDMVGVEGSSNVACNNPKALTNKQIVIKLCDGTVIDLGSKNKLTSVNYTGGDTGGGNATITYSYQTYNTFNYTAPNSGVVLADIYESDTTFPIN
jgi:hypothetical protein